MTRPYDGYRDTRLWNAVAVALAELESNRELQLATSPEYVVGYLCQELAARGIVSPEGLAPRDGRPPSDAAAVGELDGPETSR